MEPWHIQPEYTLYRGDCVEVMKTMPDNSAHSFVTDPPYGIRFMGKAWDGADMGKKYNQAHKNDRKRARTGAAAAAGKYSMHIRHMRAFQDWSHAWAVEAYRILKPGGHLVSFASTRTYHRMTVGIEDAGFEIRDQIAWTFGSGFPKSLNVGQGRGTALKPGWEPICLARKPLDGTVTENLKEWGTGAIYIDACRIPAEKMVGYGGKPNNNSYGGFSNPNPNPNPNPNHNRWPANLCHDGSEEVIAMFPREAGGGFPETRNTPKTDSVSKSGFTRFCPEGPRDMGTGSAARFFYSAKSSAMDREEGLDGVEAKFFGMSGGAAAAAAARGESYDNGDSGVNKTTLRRNIHPTVKPTELMRWLARLVTPPGGTVVDAFVGSGSTGKACVLEGLHFIGIDMDSEQTYLPIAKARIDYALKHRDRWEQIHAQETPAADTPGQTVMAL